MKNNNKINSLNFILTVLVGVAVSIVANPTRADLLVGNQFQNTILRFDETTGASLGVFASGGGLADPLGLTYGPDGNLYVASGNSDQVLRYNGTTGAFIDIFASGGGLSAPMKIIFGPDGNLYVASSNTDQVLRYNGTTGAFIDVFASGSDSGLVNLQMRSLTFGPDGNLYVASWNEGTILRYNGTTGAFMDFFVPPGSDLFTPADLAFGPDGNLYVTGFNFADRGILRYNGTTGDFIDLFASAAVFPNVFFAQFAFGSDGNIFAATQGPDGVLRFNGTTGVFINSFLAASGVDLGAPFALALSAKSQNTTKIRIDIKPGDKNNTIKLRDNEGVRVAILSINGFDAPSSVDWTSLTFGKTGVEPSLAFCEPRSRDVNRDGLSDLICQFRIKKMGFNLGDTKGVLKGKSLSGILIRGEDAVKIVK